MIAFEAPDRVYPAYIFDCDGTLANTMPLHLRAWNHGLEQAGAPLRLDATGFMSVAGMAQRQTIEHWNATHSLQIDAEIVMQAKQDYFMRHQPEIGPIDPVVTFARQCRESGAAVAVASGGGREDVLRTLYIIGLEGFFPVVVTADEVERAKPAPDLFLAAAQQLGFPPAECLVLEDSLLGIEAANLAGMNSLLIPNLLETA